MVHERRVFLGLLRNALFTFSFGGKCLGAPGVFKNQERKCSRQPGETLCLVHAILSAFRSYLLVYYGVQNEKLIKRSALLMRDFTKLYS